MYRQPIVSYLIRSRVFIKLTTVGSLLGLLLSLSVQASETDDLTTCQSCHGKALSGNPTIGAPNLTGLNSDYIAKQLSDFKSGVRGNHPKDQFGQQMRAASISLTEAQIDQLARRIAQMATIPRPATETANTRGKNIFLANCAACHHSTAKGNSSLGAPALSIQSKSYLERQLQHFREGVRGTEKSDQRGRQMAMMAKTLSTEEDLQAVVNYILSISID